MNVSEGGSWRNPNAVGNLDTELANVSSAVAKNKNAGPVVRAAGTPVTRRLSVHCGAEARHLGMPRRVLARGWERARGVDGPTPGVSVVHAVSEAHQLRLRSVAVNATQNGWPQ
jgi:hypothetical protein